MSEAEFPNQFLEGAKVGRFQLTYQTTSDVYKTKAAWTTVKIKPGTRPRTEYEYGNDMIARQMYSENSKAAVCRRKVCQSSSLAAAQQHLSHLCSRISSRLMADGAQVARVTG
jgi:hypothetical protein